MLFQKLPRKDVSLAKAALAAGWILLMILASGCSQSPAECYQQPHADLSDALDYAADDQLPFQFPLDELGLEGDPAPARFCKPSWGDDREYHAAEDYHLPAGTPVYAFADGEISFSGPMGGYGWLIIIDHPQSDIYSLYGHLSPSRWYLESGSVKKGDLIGYLGDGDENGGSAEYPLVTHLHFGVRVGQRRDYPGWGEWRWMAGWIHPCPSDLGWLRPSAVITGLINPDSGLSKPRAGLFEKWGGELGLASLYLVCGAVIVTSALKKKNPIFPLIFGGLMSAAAWYFTSRGTRIPYLLWPLAVGMVVLAIYLFSQGRKEKDGESG